MHYEGEIFRPPSEARSLLVQVTIGCAWNKCTFCDMYRAKRFRVRDMAEIREDLEEGASYGGRFRRVFLCDGDALVLPTEKLLEILGIIRRRMPWVEGVRSYASARDVLRKGADDLKALREAGLDMVYIGLESGSDRVLQAVNKGISAEEMVQAAGLLREAGIRQSISIIAGLGGEALAGEHMRETARVLNGMQPDYVGLLVLTPSTDGRFHTASEILDASPGIPQVLYEMETLLEGLELRDCLFTSAHASNRINLRGRLPGDKAALLAQVRGLRGEYPWREPAAQ